MKNKVLNIITENYKEGTVLSAKLVKVITESSGYTFTGNVLGFYTERYNYSELRIQLPITLERLMMKIIDTETSRSYKIGQIDKQTEIKKALNI